MILISHRGNIDGKQPELENSPKYILNSKSLFDGKLVGSYIPIERSIDIDTKYDFKIAKILKRKNEK